MSIIEELLEKNNLKYEDLRPEEKEALYTWLDVLSKGQVTIDKIRDYITRMKGIVEEKLCKTALNSKQDLFLKARLRNYLLFEAFLSTPEKAEQEIEKAVASFASRIKV